MSVQLHLHTCTQLQIHNAYIATLTKIFTRTPNAHEMEEPIKWETNDGQKNERRKEGARPEGWVFKKTYN